MRNRFAERGMTLIELLIAVAIGLFLMGGLFTLVQTMKRTSMSQSSLSQLQDNERMAMTLITDVIKSTGYYYNPLVASAVSSFPVVNYNANANFTMPDRRWSAPARMPRATTSLLRAT